MEYLLIALLGLVMGLISAISGGSGVFAVPILLAFGLPPINALALNRSSDLGVVMGAFRNYFKANVINWKSVLKVAPFLAAGAFLGAKLIVSIPDTWVPWIVLVGILVGSFFLLKPIKHIQKHLKKPAYLKVLGYALFALVGVWNGAIAMAGGTFAVLVFVYCFGDNFLEARSQDLMASIPEVLISLFILWSASSLPFTWILTIVLASFIGAWMGSHLAVKHGSPFVRVFMVIVAGLMMLKVLFDLVS